MRAVIFIVAVLPLAGCFGECGPTDSAQWIQPGLFEKVAAQKDATHRDPTAGLDAGATLRGYFGNVTVQGVEYVLSAPTATDQSIPFIHAALYTTPHAQLEIIAPYNYTDAQSASLLIGFLENTSASPEKWDDWERALLDQLRAPVATPQAGQPQPAIPGGGSAKTARIEAEGAWKIPNLIARLGFDKAPAGNHANMPGEYHLDQGPWGPWKIGLQIPRVEIQRNVDEGKLHLSVDALDQTFGSLEMKESPQGNHTTAINAFAKLSRSIGATPANLTSDAFHTLVC